MESLVFRIFGIIFKLVGILLITGVMASTLINLQRDAFQSKRTGLTSMLKINEQLVGKTR